MAVITFHLPSDLELSSQRYRADYSPNIHKLERRVSCRKHEVKFVSSRTEMQKQMCAVDILIVNTLLIYPCQPNPTSTNTQICCVTWPQDMVLTWVYMRIPNTGK